jgi:thiamine biosynthesis lipoprotein
MPTRRRVLTVLAAACTLPLACGRTLAASPDAVSVWRGSVMGALASLELVHPDRAHARAALAQCVAEIARLESIFSLYRADSALSRLNAAGELREPPQELVELLAFSLSLAAASAGAFDPSVQPLYRLYADHAAHPSAASLSAAAIRQVLRRVDYRRVELDAARIGFRGHGMALTLNGVAQGYITDRIAERLRRDGFTDVLVDLGEARALGRRSDGRPWQAAVRDPRDPERTRLRLPLGEDPGMAAALATSAGSGTPFGADPQVHHLLDPHTGRSANHHRSVSVGAPRATVADGLSTALAIVPPQDAAGLLRRYPGARAYFIEPDDRLSVLPRSAAAAATPLPSTAT